jgi:hypothetical protein
LENRYNKEKIAAWFLENIKRGESLATPELELTKK